MKFENGATALLEMTAFSDKMFRQSHIVGTKGELIGYGTKLEMRIFGGAHRSVFTGSPGFTGHVEGDIRTVDNFIKIICGEKTDLKDVTTIEATVASHDMALAAEKSRKNGGAPVLLKETVEA